MSLDVRDSFFVPYALMNPYAFHCVTSNSESLDNLTTVPVSSYTDAPVVPIVRHLTVSKVTGEQLTSETIKTSKVPMSARWEFRNIFFRVIGLFLVLVVAILLIFFGRKH